MKKFVVTITEYQDGVQVGDKTIATFLGKIMSFDTKDECKGFLPASLDSICDPLEEEFARLENENWGGEYIEKSDVDLSDYIIEVSEYDTKVVDFKDCGHYWMFSVEEQEF